MLQWGRDNREVSNMGKPSACVIFQDGGARTDLGGAVRGGLLVSFSDIMNELCP